ncbi:MAG: glycogen debranching enzyme, partial [Geobacteraceae bacterium]|nr:glycogen debranching enzyme [Geobacteraceae bacterium]
VDGWDIERLRNRQVKNFLAVTLISLGAPMLLMGDEVRRTQRGNNNAYCQDNEISWFDWTFPDRYRDVFRFCGHLVRRRLHREISTDMTVLSLNQVLRRARIEWHGVRLGEPDWNDDSHSIAMTTWSLDENLMYHLMFNAYHEDLRFQLPPAPPHTTSGWRRIMDTFLESPDDVRPWKDAAPIGDSSYVVQAYSIAILCARLTGAAHVPSSF